MLLSWFVEEEEVEAVEEVELKRWEENSCRL
jgi:hypothetical protein